MTKIKLTPLDDQRIGELYLTYGKTTGEISRQYGTSRTRICRVLKKLGVERNIHQVCVSKINASFKRKMCGLYLEGKSIKAISVQLRIPIGRVKAVLKEANLLSIETRIYRSKLYEVREDRFSALNDEWTVYIYGLLLADGCNTGHNITITLQEQDCYLLSKISEWVFLNHRPLYMNKKTNSRTLVICDCGIKSRLETLGVCQRKSLILDKQGDLVPDNLFGHFLRGYFDGDGCLHLCENRHRANFSLVGTEMFLENIKKRIEFAIGHNINGIYNTSSKNQIIKELKVCRNETIAELYRLLYSGSSVFLTRKKEKFETFLKLKGESYVN